MKKDTRLLGAQGEQQARSYLEQKGLQFIEANWSCKLGEIDLVMQDDTTRVFVEVRLRAPTTFGSGYETIAWQKQQKLIRAARVYQQKKQYWGDIRFDVVSISNNPTQPIIEHIENAFGL